MKYLFSASPPVVVTITEPKIKIVQIGESLTLQCNVELQTGQSDFQISWVKENGSPLPSDRATTNKDGILIITNVQSEDRYDFK